MVSTNLNLWFGSYRPTTTIWLSFMILFDSYILFDGYKFFCLDIKFKRI